MDADERGCGQEERTAKSAKDAKVRTWTEQKSETRDQSAELRKQELGTMN